MFTRRRTNPNNSSRHAERRGSRIGGKIENPISNADDDDVGDGDEVLVYYSTTDNPRRILPTFTVAVYLLVVRMELL